MIRIVTIRIVIILLVLITSDAAHGSSLSSVQEAPSVSVRQFRDTVTISNGYVQLIFDRISHRIIHLSADHSGHHRFQSELLAPGGISIGHDESTAPATVKILRLDHQHASVRFSWPTKNRGAGSAVDLTFSLSSQERGVHVQAVLPGAEGAEGITVMLRQWFQLALFERGVVQYVAGQGQYFTSANPLQLFYTMDRSNGSVALEPENGMRPVEVSLLSDARTTDSGIILRAQASSGVYDTWTDGSPLVVAPAQTKRITTIGFTLYANDLPYPAHRAANLPDGPSDALARESTAYFTAIYGSAAGVLGSYSEPGSAYPTLAHPKRAYGDAFNFFDPDAWQTVTTLAYSGDPLLQIEARRILERSESAQHSDGQMPHHFEQGGPRYLSIAQSSQTGPNIFWTLAATEYAAATGDEDWLRAHYPHLRLATDWVLSRYDSQERLVRADGPLFIDVFRRGGFTLDTNVFAFHLLGRMEEIAKFCNDPATERRYIAMRESIHSGILQKLWDGHDHFVTERHVDETTRDLVDYDGNFAALAFGVLPDGPDARKLLQRLDGGPHTHPGGYGTWVSERRYEKQDCYAENDGDSDVTMARIWWLDMAARVQLSDRSTFNSLIEQSERDLLRDVWMPERYDAKGQPAHNNYYHEYPETYAMVLREMRYGVHVGIESVTIHPFDVQRFSLHLGTLRVDYAPSQISLFVPGSNERTFTISGLIPDQQYLLSTGQRIATDAQGTLQFHARAGIKLVISQEGAHPQ